VPVAVFLFASFMFSPFFGSGQRGTDAIHRKSAKFNLISHAEFTSKSKYCLFSSPFAQTKKAKFGNIVSPQPTGMGTLQLLFTAGALRQIKTKHGYKLQQLKQSRKHRFNQACYIIDWQLGPIYKVRK
jgi:hypothetical protein